MLAWLKKWIERLLNTRGFHGKGLLFSLYSDKWGERVHAVLVLKTGNAPDPDSVIAFARTRLAGYKLPKTVAVVAELPKNAAGKVAKNELREAWARQKR